MATVDGATSRPGPERGKAEGGRHRHPDRLAQQAGRSELEEAKLREPATVAIVAVPASVPASPADASTWAPRRRAHKRGHGEGNLYQRSEDGRWIGRLMVGVKSDGRPDRRTVSGKTRAEAQKKLDELRQRVNDGILGGAKVERQTVAVFLDQWLAVTEGTLRPPTWHRYSELVHLHLSPALGKYKLTVLRPEHLQQLYTAKRKQGLAPRTVHHLHAVLHRALGQALRWGIVSRNIADAVEPPRVPRKELTPPTPVELATLLDTAERCQDPLWALWTVAVYTGCRRGELLGLKWADVDLDHRALAIRRSLQRVSAGAPIFDETKTAGSRRTIALPSEAVAALRQHRARQLEERVALGPSYAGYDLVFCTHLGTAYAGRNATRSFKAALRRAGLCETIRFHDLRHAHATVLREAGVDLKTVSERLGHSGIGITADIYTHRVSRIDLEAAQKVQEAIRGKRPDSVPEPSTVSS